MEGIYLQENERRKGESKIFNDICCNVLNKPDNDLGEALSGITAVLINSIVLVG